MPTPSPYLLFSTHVLFLPFFLLILFLFIFHELGILIVFLLCGGMGNKNTTGTEVTGDPCLPRVQWLARTEVVITRSNTPKHAMSLSPNHMCGRAYVWVRPETLGTEQEALGPGK